MMAKPAATKIRLRNKLQDRPPRPDPPLLRHLQPPPPPEIRRRRSLRPRRRRQLSEDDSYDFEHDEEEEERGLKKLRLVVKLPTSPAVRPRRATAVPSISSSSSSPSPSSSPASSSSSSYVDDDAAGENGEDEEETVKPPRKRRIAALPFSRSGRQEERKKNAVGRSSGDGPGNLLASRSGTPMPEKKELELILLKLQKNDIYGAFAEPVDPEELPDYHDVIEHPMDFATVRKKMARGAYHSFEQFEDDVLLICSNAMQYNAPDTVYFRQACVIQDLARKKFQNVRDNLMTENDQLIEEKARLSSMEKKPQLAQCTPKTQRKTVVEPHLPDVYSGSTLASTNDTCTRLSTVNGIEKSVAINELLNASSRRGSKQEKSVIVNELLTSKSMGEIKQEKTVAVNRTLDNSSSLGESKQEKSVAVNRFLDVSSSPRESKLEKSAAFIKLLDTSSQQESKPQKSVAASRFLDASSSLMVSKQEKSVAVNRFLDASSSPRESKQEKSVAVNRCIDTSFSPEDSKQERPAAVSGLLDGNSSLGENKQEKPVSVNGLDTSSSLGERKQEKGDDFSAKSSPSKLGRKPVVVDENRRTTYSITPEQRPTSESDFVLNVLEDEQKQLVPVGLDAEHSYARSLAHFAASLGPLAWEIVSKKIEKSLPPGIKFGPGWVGEYEPLPAPFLSVEKHNQQLTSSSTSFSRTNTKDKATEMKSKKHLTSTSHRKTPNSCKSTSCDNSGEQKPRLLGVCNTAQLKTNGTFEQKQCIDSNNTNSAANSQMSNRKTYIASVRVKEESPSEEITDRRQEVICANDLTHPGTRMNLHQPKNQAATFSNVSLQARAVNSSPSPKDRHTSFPGIFSRESSHMQTEKEVRAVSSQNLNNAPDIDIGSSNNVAKVNISLPFVTSNQTGVNYGVIRGNNIDQASTDPFKLSAFPGKVGNQQNLSMPIVSPLCKETYNSSAASAARAWMSVGTSAQWKPVDGKITSEKSNTSFCHASWRPPAHFNGDLANFHLQTEAPHVKNRGLVIFPQLMPTDLSKYKNHPHWQSSSPQPQNKKRDNLPPDLNIGYHPPTSPIQPSNLAMDSQQPDLALQL